MADEADEEKEGKGEGHKIVYIQHDKKKRKELSEKPSEDIYDWLESLKHAVGTRFKTDKEKIDFTLDHVLAGARTHVKTFRTNPTGTFDGLCEHLLDIYGEADVEALTHNLYSSIQVADETLDGFAIRIMNSLLRMHSSTGHKSTPTEDQWLLCRIFSAGVIDVYLRRELLRLREEFPSLTFVKLQKKAKAWVDSVSSGSASHQKSKAGKSHTVQSAGVVTSDVATKVKAHDAQIQSLASDVQNINHSLKELTQAVKALNRDSPSDAPYREGSGHHQFRLKRGNGQFRGNSGQNSQNSSRGARSSGPSRTRFAGSKCGNCGNYGHTDFICHASPPSDSASCNKIQEAAEVSISSPNQNKPTSDSEKEN